MVMGKLETDDTKLAVMAATITRMGQDLTEIKNDFKDLKGTYASKEELVAQIKIMEAEIRAVDTKYELSRTLIFGLCGLTLIAIVGAVLTLILRGNG